MSITIEDVRKKLIEIDASKSDYQAAHGIEDDLWGQVLEAIATGAENARSGGG